MWGFHPIYIVVILVIVLIIFGPGRLGDLGTTVGRNVSGFRKAMSEGKKAEDKPQVTSEVAKSSDAGPGESTGPAPS